MGYPVNVDECGRYFSSRTTEPDTGLLTPRSPSRSSSVSRNEFRFAIILAELLPSRPYLPIQL